MSRSPWSADARSFLPPSCERTAQFVSLELDGELSAYGRAMLRRHLQRCENCAEYAREVTGLTGLLRAAPLEECRLPVTLPHRRRRVSTLARNVATAAAAAAVAVWLSVSFTGGTRSQSTFRTFNPRPVAIPDDSRDWAAGLPRTARVVQLVPGGLQTTGTSP